MNIILEGIDGSGKTTLAEKLVTKYKMTTIHSTAYTKNDLAYHIDLLNACDNTVFDRFQIGEKVFPIMYGRESKLTDEDICKINKCIIDKNDLVVVFISSSHKLIADRIKARGENTEWEIDQQIELFSKYAKEYFSDYDNFYLIDVALPDAYVELDRWLDKKLRT